MVILWVNFRVRPPPSWNSVFGTTWLRFSSRSRFRARARNLVGPGPDSSVVSNFVVNLNLLYSGTRLYIMYTSVPNGDLQWGRGKWLEVTVVLWRRSYILVFFVQASHVIPYPTAPQCTWTEIQAFTKSLYPQEYLNTRLDGPTGRYIAARQSHR